MAAVDNSKEQIDQRSAFQFRLIEFNMIAAAVFASLALRDKTFWDALLVVPFVSLLLFVFWFHHGVVIRLMGRKKPQGPMHFWSWVRILSFVFVVLGNFLGVPIAAVLLHQRGHENLPVGWIQFTGLYVIPAIILVLVLMWVYLQYLKREWPKGVDDGSAEQAGPADA